MIRIKVEGKNIADIWKLECVDAIYKNKGMTKVAVRIKMNGNCEYDHLNAYPGDEIEVETEYSPTAVNIIPDYPF